MQQLQTDEVNKGGRPIIELTEKDWNTIEKLCSLHCTGEEIAGILDIDYDTLNTRIKEKYGYGFSDYFKKKSAKGSASLRRRQYELAMDGNPTMLVWLGKQYLGQVDKQGIDHTTNGKDLETVVNNFNGDAQAASQAYQDIMGGK